MIRVYFSWMSVLIGLITNHRGQSFLLPSKAQSHHRHGVFQGNHCKTRKLKCPLVPPLGSPCKHPCLASAQFQMPTALVSHEESVRSLTALIFYGNMSVSVRPVEAPRPSAHLPHRDLVFLAGTHYILWIWPDNWLGTVLACELLVGVMVNYTDERPQNIAINLALVQSENGPLLWLWQHWGWPTPHPRPYSYITEYNHGDYWINPKMAPSHEPWQFIYCPLKGKMK